MKFLKKVSNVAISLALLLQLSGLSPFIGSQVAKAAQVCSQDSAGANDVPGQKDLTLMCVDYASVPTTITTKWNWDDTGTSGNNSLDACSLFDTDNDGFANFAVCVTTNDNPAEFSTLTTYSCGDSRPDRCTSSASAISSGSTQCTIAQAATNPFNGGNDTVATCIISLATIGGSSAQLLDVCSYPSQQPNSDPSDCIVRKNNTGKIEVRKVLTTSNSDTFNLQIDGTTKAVAVVNGGTTGEQLVASGNHTVGETAASGSLSNYTKSIVCKNLNGTGSIVAQNATGTTLTVPVADLSDIVCVITNTQLTATITLVKQIANTAATTTPALPNDFSLKLGSTPVLSGIASTVTPGTYTASEVNLPGYSPGTWTGTGCSTNGSITITAGQNLTCTIVNTAITPTVTLKKVVTPGPGVSAVPADFQLTLNSVNQPQNTPINITAGQLQTVGEVSKTGYTKTSTTCRTLPTGIQVVTTSITPALGTNYECTVTNAGVQPNLNVTKHVINSHGGTKMATDFSLYVNGGTALNDARSGGGDVNESSVTYLVGDVVAGTAYTVTEDSVSGYVKTSTVCTDQDTKQVVQQPVVLALGQNVACVVTNEDVAPTIEIKKEFINQWGTLGNPATFTFSLDNLAVQLNTPTAVQAGTHSISESTVKGFHLDSVGTEGESCTMLGIGGTITVTVGGTYTCTLYNVDEPATLTIVKEVSNTHGGYADASSFEDFIHINDIADTSWTLDTPFSIRTDTDYTVTEDVTTIDGYELDSIACTDTTNEVAAALSMPFDAYPAQEITCVVTNKDIAPKLTLNKVVINDNGGTAEASDWTLSATQQVKGGEPYVLSGLGIDDETNDIVSGSDMQAGTYVLDESGETNGYEASSWDCGEATINGNILNIELGEEVTCTITNDDIAPYVKVIKQVYGDIDSVFTFNMGEESAEVTGNMYGDTDNVHIFRPDAGETTLSEDVDTSAWLTYYYCYSNNERFFESGKGTEVALELSPAQNITCYFTNVQKAVINVTKYSDLNKNGQKDEGEPTLPDWAIQATVTGETEGGSNSTYKTGLTGADGSVSFDVLDEFDLSEQYTFAVTETQQAGWELTNITCSVVDPIYPDNEEEVVLDRQVMEIQPLIAVDQNTDTLRPGSVATCFVGNYKAPVVPPVDPPKLSDTGISASIAMYIAGAVIVSLAGLEFAKRKY